MSNMAAVKALVCSGVMRREYRFEGCEEASLSERAMRCGAVLGRVLFHIESSQLVTVLSCG